MLSPKASLPQDCHGGNGPDGWESGTKVTCVKGPLYKGLGLEVACAQAPRARASLRLKNGTFKTTRIRTEESRWNALPSAS